MRTYISLQVKLLLAIGVILLSVFALTEILNYQAMQVTEKKNLQDQAERVRSLLMAYRKTQQQVFLDYKVPLDEVTLHFLPAFAIGEISKEYPNWDPSGFKFNNVSDQPRRPEHQADALEMSAMDYFRRHPEQKILFQSFTNAQGEAYYLYARPIWIEEHCLKCHAKREDAPKTVREKYDTAWGYKVGDLRGILSIKVPAEKIKQRTQASFMQHLWIQFAGFISIFILVMWFVRTYISSPLWDLIAVMRSITQGNYTQRLSGFRGEFGILSAAFNEMSEKIASQQQALRQWNEELEQRVADRTQELALANQEINALNKRLQSENMRMGAELEITRRLQQMVLPSQTELNQIEHLDIAGFMEPANEVGGDYYDVLQHNGMVKFGIGDVTGHGLESGVLMIMVQTAVRSLLLNNQTDPQIFMNVLNQVIYQNTQRIDSDKNLTLALLDYHDKTLTLCGQHEEVLVVRKNGTIERIDTIDLGFCVGLEPDIAPFVQQQSIHLEAGDGIVLYTDGIVEAFNWQQEVYGVERLCHIVAANWSGCSADIRQAIIEDVHRHLGNLPLLDDLTLLIIKQK